MSGFDIICLTFAIYLIGASAYGYHKMGGKIYLFPLGAGALLLVTTLFTLNKPLHLVGVC